MATLDTIENTLLAPDQAIARIKAARDHQLTEIPYSMNPDQPDALLRLMRGVVPDHELAIATKEALVQAAEKKEFRAALQADSILWNQLVEVSKSQGPITALYDKMNELHAVPLESSGYSVHARIQSGDFAVVHHINNSMKEAGSEKVIKTVPTLADAKQFVNDEIRYAQFYAYEETKHMSSIPDNVREANSLNNLSLQPEFQRLKSGDNRLAHEIPLTEFLQISSVDERKSHQREDGPQFVITSRSNENILLYADGKNRYDVVFNAHKNAVSNAILAHSPLSPYQSMKTKTFAQIEAHFGPQPSMPSSVVLGAYPELREKHADIINAVNARLGKSALADNPQTANERKSGQASSGNP